MDDLIAERDLDVLCLTETWLREAGDDVSIGEVTPPGFSFLHRPWVSPGQRWGCCNHLPTSQGMLM